MSELTGIAIRPKARAPMETLDTCLVTPERGLTGDARGRPGKRQVTVLTEEAWQQACAQLGQNLPWTIRRANLLVRGIDLGPHRVGSLLRVGELLLRITGETDPCHRMDEAAPGLKDALAPHWRGGVCCQVIRGGAIAIGDPLRLEPAP